MHTFTFLLPESLLQCRNQILRLLNADRQPDRVGSDSLLRQLFLRTLAVSGGCRMNHQRFHVCYICQQGKDRQLIDKCLGRLRISLNLKSKDRAASVREISLI